MHYIYILIWIIIHIRILYRGVHYIYTKVLLQLFRFLFRNCARSKINTLITKQKTYTDFYIYISKKNQKIHFIFMLWSYSFGREIWLVITQQTQDLEPMLA